MKRTLAICLLMAMVIALLPLQVFAETPQQVSVGENGESVVIMNGTAGVEAVNEVVEGLPKLATPTDLKWGYAYEWMENPDTGEWGEMMVEKPGSICWKPVEPDQAHAFIEIYRQGESEPAASTSWHFGSQELPEWRTVDDFILSDLESGSYYFTVTSVGDGLQYSDSDAAVSDVWTYVQPDKQLGACTNLTWAERYGMMAACWVNPDNTTGYEVEFYFAASADEEPYPAGGTWHASTLQPNQNVNEQFTTMYDDMLERCGDGYYYFKVRAITPDVTQYRNGPWSELSEPYCTSAVSSDVNTKLDDILESDASAEDIKDAVQSMDTEELKTAMLANDETMDKLEQLEQKAGGAAPVAVSDAASAFDAEKVSVVGANLNSTAADAAGDITLVIDKPAKENVIPAQYDNSVAVKFSMELENVESPKNLAVPVKVTLPIPASINPSFLAILHYHADGTVEEITMPYVFSENGQYYASFVLTSFSDFAMTQALSIPVYRLYNQYTNEHLLVSNEAEKDNLLKAGWSLDGAAWNAPTTGDAVYRLYNPYDDFHFYTMSMDEVNSLLPLGWTMDGPVSCSAGTDGQPVYRLFNPYEKTNYHMFTASEEERDFLASLGWQPEGVAWYASK